MCRAMEEMRDQVAEQATFKTRLNDIRSMVENFNLTVNEVMNAMKIPESERERYLAAI